MKRKNKYILFIVRENLSNKFGRESLSSFDVVVSNNGISTKSVSCHGYWREEQLFSHVTRPTANQMSRFD